MGSVLGRLCVQWLDRVLMLASAVLSPPVLTTLAVPLLIQSRQLVVLRFGPSGNLWIVMLWSVRRLIRWQLRMV